MAQEKKGSEAAGPGAKERDPLCTVCGAGNSVPFFTVREVPVFANVLCDTEPEALAVPRGDIELAFCASCGHVRNTAFDPVLVDYAPRYENALHFSPRFRAYAKDLAGRLVETYDIRGKDVIEIGCGDGQFLGLLCDLGKNRGCGFDPGHDPERSGDLVRGDMEIIADYYSDRHADRRADLVCCRHVLEHVADPVGFLRDMARSVGTASEAVYYFEVPNALYTLRDLGIWDILYEHCSYFTEPSLRRLFTEAGFRILATRVDYGNQFLSVEALLEVGGEPSGGPAAEEGGSSEANEELAALVEEFGNAYRRKTAEWYNRLEEMKEKGRRAVVWGAGTKGIMFLNTVKAPGVVEYVVDINPRKHGKHVSGAGQRIVPPESLQEARPDAVVVMNAEYADEIREKVRALGIETELLSA